MVYINGSPETLCVFIKVNTGILSDPCQQSLCRLGCRSIGILFHQFFKHTDITQIVQSFPDTFPLDGGVNTVFDDIDGVVVIGPAVKVVPLVRLSVVVCPVELSGALAFPGEVACLVAVGAGIFTGGNDVARRDVP